MTALSLPPLLTGMAVSQPIDPFAKACAQAAIGCDGGLVVYAPDQDPLAAAMVFAPEVPLTQAMAMVPVCGIGFQNALGALAPPEVAVHLEWGGGLRVNGAACGRLRVAASTEAPAEVPDWLVVGIEVPLWPAADGGATPDRTALFAEGCAEVDPGHLLEAWARHTLVWINRWSDGEAAAIHAEWRGLAQGMGEEITIDGQIGTFVGVDEDFGLLLRTDTDTRLIPLTRLLEGAA